MKNITIWPLCFLIIFLISCKDKPKPRPKPTANINDILGIWVSVDSIIRKIDNNFVYTHDAFFVGKDTLVGGLNYSIYIESYIYNSVFIDSMGGGGYAYYSAKYFGMDSLILNYTGPGWLLTPAYKHKVYYNTTKDTITIIDFRTTYPGRPFNVFYKKNK